MSIKGNEKRDTVLEAVLRFLWVGDVDGAENYLSSLEMGWVKNEKILNQLIDYFERKRDNIACYALRAKLGLRNSSNPVEKANDILVVQRQKHNGMSWSSDGSGALAAITMLWKNQRLDQWLTKGEFSFAMHEICEEGEIAA